MLRWLKNKYHLVRSFFAAVYFGFPAGKIKVVGVTGTNGKTTTIQMVGKILEENGHRVALASTINFKFAEKEWVNKTKFTTLSAWEVQKFISNAVKEKCEYLVLEVSSHALDQSRLYGVCFDVVAITNITREHLDYHLSMEKYREAKAKLFRKLKKDGICVVNLDMEDPEDFIEIAKQGGHDVMTFTTSFEKQAMFGQADDVEVVFAEEIVASIKGSEFVIDEEKFQLNLPGVFNIENALAAICVGSFEGVSLSSSKKALEKIQNVSGRMDYVKNKREISIIVDYALTPDSMERIGTMLKKAQDNQEFGKIIWVFGSCGERDRGKRPIMGEIVARYADFAIVTNEDPYHEDPMQIMNEVFEGVISGGKNEGENCWKILDRREAIKKALEIAKKGDLVLITGKGAEETMAIGKKRIEWNDRKVIEELLSEL
jgi:UDP-N-acetylmuramoyl-L-alanyl-D-glutamate--2,6-diaminopimelate ligase